MLVSRPHRGDDSGSALVTVLIVVLVLGMITLGLSSAISNTTRTTVSVRGSLQAQAAADAGLTAAYAAAKAAPAGVCSLAPSSTVAPRYTVTASCPAGSGQVTFTSTGYGEGPNPATSKAQATYTYAGSATTSSPDSALLVGSGNFSVNALSVSIGSTATNSAARILKGDFYTCNNTSRFGTDVILATGSLNLTNTCNFDKDVYVAGNLTMTSAATIKGSIYVLGDVSITNATVTVGGNIYAKGNITLQGKVAGKVVTEKNLTLSTGGAITGDASAGGNVDLGGGSSVKGSVTAPGSLKMSGNSSIGGNAAVGGALDLNAATVTGALSSASTQPAGMYAVSVGSISIGGPFKQNFQASTVTGDVVSAQKNAQSYIAPDVKIGGTLRLGGTISTWGGGPTASRGTFTNVNDLVAPPVPASQTVAVPDNLKPGASNWQDYGFTSSEWVATGYAVDVWPSSGTCDLRQWPPGPANVARLTGYSVPTVADMRGCGQITGYQANLAFKTDVVVLLSANGSTHDFQEAKITSADGQPHKFSIVVPDTTKDSLPTCANSASTIGLYGTTLGTSPKMTGLVYTPCTLSIGYTGSVGNWTGQLYSGALTFGGGGGTGYQFVYEPVGVPSFGSDSSSAPTIGGLISRRDVG
jgi:Tfp pilus assembly protein PilX/cytoskeletal protein CcmA (bactofilin family)